MPGFVAISPNTDEHGNYAREPRVPMLKGVFTVRGVFEEMVVTRPLQAVIYAGDPAVGNPHLVTALVPPSGGTYTFTFDTRSLPDGNGVFAVCDELGKIYPYGFQILVRNTTAPLDPMITGRPLWLWMCSRKFEQYNTWVGGTNPDGSPIMYPLIAQGIACVPWDGRRAPELVTPAPVKVFERAPRTTLPTSRLDLYGIPFGARQKGYVRNLGETFEGGFVVNENEQYRHNLQALTKPYWDMGDGQVPLSYDGYYGAAWAGPGKGFGGVFVGTTSGNILHVGYDRKRTLLVGWRLKKDRVGPYHAYADLEPPSAARDAWVNDKYELVGDWSRIKPPHVIRETWGGEGVPVEWVAKGLVPHPAGHQFAIADQLNHRILFGDVTPILRGGQTALYTLAETAAGGLLDKVWDLAWDREREALVAVLLERGMIARIPVAAWLRSDKSTPIPESQAEVLFRTQRAITYPDVGRVDRWDVGNKTCAVARNHLATLGPVEGASGEAILSFPQGIVVRPAPWNDYVVMEGYTGRLCRIDPATGELTTYCVIGKWINVRESSVDIDYDGTFGPKGRIYVAGWTQNTETSVVPLASDPKKGGMIAWAGKWDGVGDPVKDESGESITNIDYPTVPVALPEGFMYLGTGKWQDLVLVINKPAWLVARDWPRIQRGLVVFRTRQGQPNAAGVTAPMALTHGFAGWNRLGVPTAYEMATWTVEKRRAYIAEFYGLDPTAPLPTWATDLEYALVELPGPMDPNPLTLSFNIHDGDTVPQGTVPIRMTVTGGKTAAELTYTVIVDGAFLPPVRTTARELVYEWDTRALSGAVKLRLHVSDTLTSAFEPDPLTIHVSGDAPPPPPEAPAVPERPRAVSKRWMP